MLDLKQFLVDNGDIVQCCNVQKKKGPVLQCSEEKRSSVAMFTASTSIKSQRERRPLEGLAGLFCSPEKKRGATQGSLLYRDPWCNATQQCRGLYYIETPVPCNARMKRDMGGMVHT